MAKLCGQTIPDEIYLTDVVQGDDEEPDIKTSHDLNELTVKDRWEVAVYTFSHIARVRVRPILEPSTSQYKHLQKRL